MRTPIVLAVMLSTACSSVAPQPTDSTPVTSPSSVDAAPLESELASQLPRPHVDEPAPPDVDQAELLDAPPRYELLILRAALPIGHRYADLGYEGNNNNFRAAADASGLFRSGDETAADWRRFAAGVDHLVVLRDSLFSQQDHPTLQTPRALMLPPSWVSVAVAEVMAGRELLGPRSADVDDDAAWAGDELDAYFGSFPASARLFADASRPLAGASASEAAMTRNARTSMRMLADATAAMIVAAPHGPEAVAQTGGEWIAASDRSYFGAALRRDKILPIFVENPNEHELRDEGKGLSVWGRELPSAAIELTATAVYGRRLQDGPIALERYDLRDADVRARAIALLERLVPRGSTGHAIWLWVNGGSDGHGNGDPALPYIPDFRRELEAGDIELARVILLSKPSVRPWGDDGKRILEDAVDEYAALGIPLSVQLSTAQLQKLLR